MNGKEDFYISYAAEDERWAIWISGILENAGYTTAQFQVQFIYKLYDIFKVT